MARYFNRVKIHFSGWEKARGATPGSTRAS